jgi:hypothetical protein
MQVSAASLFEAAALTVAQFLRCGCTDVALEARSSLTVGRPGRSRRHRTALPGVVDDAGRRVELRARASEGHSAAEIHLAKQALAKEASPRDPGRANPADSIPAGNRNRVIESLIEPCRPSMLTAVRPTPLRPPRAVPCPPGLPLGRPGEGGRGRSRHWSPGTEYGQRGKANTTSAKFLAFFWSVFSTGRSDVAGLDGVQRPLCGRAVPGVPGV